MLDRNINALNLKTNWQSYIALLSVVSIFVYLILSLTKNAMSDFPLLFIIVIGGIPLFVQIIVKLLKGNIGADLLAAISLIAGVVLQEYNINYFYVSQWSNVGILCDAQSLFCFNGSGSTHAIRST